MSIRYKAIKFKQGNNVLYMFAAKADEIWGFSSINKKTEDKTEGYQRALSSSRADDIRKYVQSNNTIAPAIILSFDSDKAQFDEATSEIVIEDNESAAWVIDGQHRLRGASLVDGDEVDIELPVVAYIGLDLSDQILQFVTINREAKGVPTSLYYDLLKFLPTNRKPADVAKEKAADTANTLRKDIHSVFYDKIVVVTSPRKGQISLNNFVRKIHPLLLENKGSFSSYSQQEFTLILENYFRALKSVFPEEFSIGKYRFFQTLGFGAVVNALFPIFSITLKEKGGFTAEEVESMLSKVSDFQFSDWDNVGTGTAAENQAGKDFETYFKIMIESQAEGTSKMIRL